MTDEDNHRLELLLKNSKSDPVHRFEQVLEQFFDRFIFHTDIAHQIFDEKIDKLNIEKYFIFFIKERLNEKNKEKNCAWKSVFESSDVGYNSFKRRHRRLQVRDQEVEEGSKGGAEGRKEEAKGVET